MIPMYRLMWLSDPSDYVTPFRTTHTLYSTWCTAISLLLPIVVRIRLTQSEKGDREAEVMKIGSTRTTQSIRFQGPTL